jgi:hypothetical protein
VLRGRIWWEIIPEGVPVKLSKRDKMPGGEICWGGEYVLAACVAYSARPFQYDVYHIIEGANSSSANLIKLPCLLQHLLWYCF